MTDDLSAMLGAELTEMIRLPKRSARLEFSSMLAERRLLAMRRRVLPSALGALGQRAERLIPSLTMLFRRRRSSAVLPPKAISSQLPKRLVEGRGLKCEISCVGTISLVGLKEVAVIHP